MRRILHSQSRASDYFGKVVNMSGRLIGKPLLPARRQFSSFDRICLCRACIVHLCADVPLISFASEQP
jgi:hypothetical protein